MLTVYCLSALESPSQRDSPSSLLKMEAPSPSLLSSPSLYEGAFR